MSSLYPSSVIGGAPTGNLSINSASLTLTPGRSTDTTILGYVHPSRVVKIGDFDSDVMVGGIELKKILKEKDDKIAKLEKLLEQLEKRVTNLEFQPYTGPEFLKLYQEEVDSGLLK